MEIKYKTLEEGYKTWIKALRLGKYKQTQEYLYDGNNPDTDKTEGGFCCLGVALECMRKDGSGAMWDRGDYTSLDKSFDSNKCLGVLPDYIRKGMKMTSKQHSKLINMNDAENRTFKEIADYIEKKILPLALKK